MFEILSLCIYLFNTYFSVVEWLTVIYCVCTKTKNAIAYSTLAMAWHTILQLLAWVLGRSDSDDVDGYCVSVCCYFYIRSTIRSVANAIYLPRHTHTHTQGEFRPTEWKKKRKKRTTECVSVYKRNFYLILVICCVMLSCVLNSFLFIFRVHSARDFMFVMCYARWRQWTENQNILLLDGAFCVCSALL